MASTSVALRRPAGIGPPVVSFGLAELGRALGEAEYELTDDVADVEIGVGLVIDDLPATRGGLRPADRPEAYTVMRTGGGGLALVGRDDRGLMYACLDVAEQVAMGAALDEIVERDAAPALAVRGLYTFVHNTGAHDTGVHDAGVHDAGAEQGWLHDPDYWQRYADELARCRFNRFTLVYGHQTAYLIPIYAHLLDDLDDQFPQLRVAGITSEERARNLRTLQTASAAMASRGLWFFLGIWQSRPWTVAGGERENQPTRVVGAKDLDLLAEYTRRGFARLLELCPDIGGIQLRVNVESGVADQRFFVRAFLPPLGELAARGRRLTVELLNRGLQPATIEAFQGAGVDVVVSARYSAAHQGLPYQPPAMRGGHGYDSLVRKDKPFSLQWQLGSHGSHRLFAWGDPDYARRFARSCTLGDGVGFEVTPPGSQKGFSQWGQVSRGDWQPRHDLPRRPDFERYWLFYLAFGRMGFDPSTSIDVFLHHLAWRTNEVAAPALLAAYRSASRVVSYLVSQRMDDPDMYVWPELDCGGPIDHHAIAPPGDPTLFATAREHAADVLAGRGSARRSPFDAAHDLRRFSSGIEEALAQIQLEPMPSLEDNLEFRTLKLDFEALGALARYHAAKARAAGNLALFYASGERKFLDAAESDAESGVRRWEELCARTVVYHDRLHFGPSGGHWRDNRPRVGYDLSRVRRVRELFDAYGLFVRGFDFGQAIPDGPPPGAASGLEPEPRFVGVDAATAYTPERGHGWLQTGGLRAEGFAQLPRDLVWGVHYLRPDSAYDPAAIEAMPLDGLTNRYLTAARQRTFRVDLPNGEYELTVLAPRATSLGADARVDGKVVGAGVWTNTTVKGGALPVTVGGDGPWALAGLIVRRPGPRIAHLPAPALRGEQNLVLTATATSGNTIRSMSLRHRTGSPDSGRGGNGRSASPDWRETIMEGDGVAFRAAVPARDLSGEALEYELIAEDEAGRVGRRGTFRVPIVRGFRPPRVVEVVGPDSWRSGDELRLGLSLEQGEFAREVRVHYREADQDRDFRMAAQPGRRSDEYVFRLDTGGLDDAYDLIYYFEIVDVLGGGSFCPDPIEDARYVICRPVR